MPRRRKVEITTAPAEEDQPNKTRKKLVDAKHTITYEAPVPVDVAETEETEPEAVFDFDDDTAEEISRKRRRKTAKDERDELRRELDRYGVAPASSLRLSIEKYRHSEAVDSGTMAEKEFCTKYACQKDHIINDDFLDVARRYGPGRYWFTLRLENKIVRMWEKQISGGPSITGPLLQQPLPIDPASPQIVVQTPDGAQQPIAQPLSWRDMIKFQDDLFKRKLEEMKLFREAVGMPNEQYQGAPAITDPKVAALQLIAENPDVMEKLGKGIASTVLGVRGGSDDMPWYATAIIKAIENGQAAEIVGTLVREALASFKNFGVNNGQAPMAQAALPNQTPQIAGQQQGQFVSGLQMGQEGRGPQLGPQDVSRGPSGNMPDAAPAGSDAQIASSPEDQALQLVIDHCAKSLPPQIAFNRLMAMADLINEQAPQYSLDGYIMMFATMTTDAAIEFVKSRPNGESVTSLPHTREWTEALQKLIRESMEGEGEE